MLQIQNVTVNLAGVNVLRTIHAELHAGTAVAVVGHNGAGKTTLLRTIMGLLPAREGHILLDGNDLLQRPAHSRASAGIGYAPEERVIFPTMSVLENLRLPCEVNQLTDTEIQERLEMVLDTVPQLEVMLNRSGSALSGGQGKMVALGRALMIGTRLVLLDEPFQGLAPVLALQYADALGRLRRARPDLCIVITESNASLLQGIPDLTLILERGSLQSRQENTQSSLSQPEPA